MLLRRRMHSSRMVLDIVMDVAIAYCAETRPSDLLPNVRSRYSCIAQLREGVATVVRGCDNNYIHICI